MCLHWLYYYVSHRLAPQQCLAFYWYCFFFHPSSLCFFFFSLLYYFYWPYRFTNSHIPGLSLFCKPWFRDLHPAYLYKETALYNHCMRPNSNHPYSTLHIQHSIKYARSWSQYWMVLSIAIAALWKYTYCSFCRLTLMSLWSSTGSVWIPMWMTNWMNVSGMSEFVTHSLGQDVSWRYPVSQCSSEKS